MCSLFSVEQALEEKLPVLIKKAIVEHLPSTFMRAQDPTPVELAVENCRAPAPVAEPQQMLRKLLVITQIEQTENHVMVITGEQRTPHWKGQPCESTATGTVVRPELMAPSGSGLNEIGKLICLLLLEIWGYMQEHLALEKNLIFNKDLAFFKIMIAFLPDRAHQFFPELSRSPPPPPSVGKNRFRKRKH